jgi:hypothetical protein
LTLFITVIIVLKKEEKQMTDRQRRLRDYFAAKVMSGMCSGDWKLDLSSGKTWDEVAAKRAYEIADAMLAEREIENVPTSH